MVACTKADFRTWQRVYESGTGDSGFLDDYGEETDKNWRLTIDRRNPKSISNYGKRAGSRTYSEVIRGWQRGYEIDWAYCAKDGNYYKVEWGATLRDISPAAAPCKESDFEKGRRVYVSGDGYSGFLDRYGRETGKKWRLTVARENVEGAKRDSKIKGSRRYSEVISGWKDGWEIDYIYCSSDKYYYEVVWDAKLEDITPVPPPPVVVVPPVPTYKVLPAPPATIHDEGIVLYKKLDQALFDKNAPEVVKLLKDAISIPQSPTPLLVLIFGIAGVAALIASLLGSYPFAGFLREEAIQTLDIGIMTATKNKDVEGLENLIRTKEEILERTTWEKMLGAIPILTVVTSLWDYWTATRAKLEIDKSTLELLRLETGTVTLPEEIRTYVRDIVDGDTIEVDMTAYDNKTGSEIRLPQKANTTHASVRVVGINAPEKSPKGEILCSEIEIYKVEPRFADLSRNALLPLNDKRVVLMIDPTKPTDGYGRILAKVTIDGRDVGLTQIKNGLACWYFREVNKQIDDELYKSETLKAKDAGVGMWSAIVLAAPADEVVAATITFSIDSEPSGAKVYIDEIYTHHLTPTSEVEQKDVIGLWTEGMHKLRLVKSGYSQEGEIELVRGEPLTINWTLGGITKPLEVVPPEVPPPVVPPPVVPPPVVVIPETLQEFYDLIKTYYVGRLYLSKTELVELESKFKLETPGVVPLVSAEIQTFYADLKTYYVGLKYLSKSELIELGEKYGLNTAGLE